MDDETGVGAREQPRTRHVWWSLVFGVSGIALLPWIVVLAVVQPPTAAVGNLPLAAGGALATIAAGLLVSAALSLTDSRYITMTASGTAALAVCTGFFHVITGTANHPRAAAFATVVVLGPVAVLCGVAALRPARPRSPVTGRVLAALFVVGAVATLLAWARAASAGFPAQDAHHLKATWILLDVAEAVALLTTAAALRWHPGRVAVAASVTGALLCCDVWFNVVGAVGEAKADAVQMAFVSLPLAAAAFGVGVQVVRTGR